MRRGIIVLGEPRERERSKRACEGLGRHVIAQH